MAKSVWYMTTVYIQSFITSQTSSGGFNAYSKQIPVQAPLKLKYECDYYTEDTIVTPQHPIEDQVHLMTSDSKVLPYIFSGPQKFFCYVNKVTSLRYGEKVIDESDYIPFTHFGLEDYRIENYFDPTVLYCQYESNGGGETSPVLEFDGLETKGYLVPSGYDVVKAYEDGINGTGFSYAPDLTHYASVRYAEYNVSKNSVACINYDYLRTEEELKKRNSEFNIHLQSKARSTWLVGMILTFSIFFLIVLLCEEPFKREVTELTFVYVFLVISFVYNAGLLMLLYAELGFWKEIFRNPENMICLAVFGAGFMVISTVAVLFAVTAMLGNSIIEYCPCLILGYGLCFLGISSLFGAQIPFAMQIHYGHGSFFFYLPYLTAAKTPINDFQIERDGILATNIVAGILLIGFALIQCFHNVFHAKFKQQRSLTITTFILFVYIIGAFTFEIYLWYRYKGHIYMLMESTAMKIYMEWFHICASLAILIWLSPKVNSKLLYPRELRRTMEEKRLLPKYVVAAPAAQQAGANAV